MASKKIGDTFKRFFTFYKDHYFMPKEFLPQTALKNRNNTIIVNFLIFLFSITALIVLHVKYWNHVWEYKVQIIYFTFYFAYSLIGLIWCLILKKRNVLKYKHNNAPLIFCALGFLTSIWYRFFISDGHINAILLLGVLSLVLIVLFEVEPLFFLVFEPLSAGMFIPGFYHDFGWTGVFDLCLFTVVVIWLAFYTRRMSIRFFLKNEMLKAHKEGLQWEVEQRIEELNRKETILLEQHHKLLLVQDNTIISLTNLVENRDSDTGEHVRRTASYVGILASALMEKGYYTDILNPNYISLAIKAAPLHDIGKIVISDNILKKPGRLNEDEYDEIKKHTTEGKRIVLEVLGNGEDPAYVKMAQEIAYSHHEKWNGEGYPLGLKEDSIPLSARIMAIADVFDALVSPRCYKEPIPVEAAFEILREEMGNHFDPIMIPVFLEQKLQIFSVMEKYKD